MGTNAPAERRPDRMREQEESEKRKRVEREKTGPFYRRYLRSIRSVSILYFSISLTNSLFFLFFVLFAFLPGKSSAQDLNSLSTQILNGSVEQKRDALFQIRNLRSEAASRVAAPALKDADEIVRATAVSSVIFLPKPEAAQTLIPLLIDKAPFVRRETAFALGETGDASAAPALIKTLERDVDAEVRLAAAIALGKIGEVLAVDALTSILKKKPKDEDEALRRAAARSVGQIAQIMQGGTASVVTPESFLPEKYKRIESGKFTNLTMQFPAFHDAVGPLTRLLQNPKESDDARREAAFALGAIGDRSAIPALQANLSSTDIYLTEICKEALQKLSQPQ